LFRKSEEINMKKIALLGALDRNNYGDLLFPIIFKKWMENNNNNYEYEVYASIDSDLSSIGALPTKNINKLYNSKVDVVVLVGGAILSSSWLATHLHLIQNKFISLLYRVIYKIVGANKGNSIARIILKGKTVLPWIIPTSLFESPTKVIYNAGSGTDFSIFNKAIRQEVANDLNDSTYISVRDPLSKKNLEDLGVNNIHIAPDSAIIMSDIYPVEDLKQLISIESVKFFGENSISKNYLCFQIANKYAKGFEHAYIEILQKICQENNLDLLLLPIGRANLHDDQIPLQLIYDNLKDKMNVYLVKENTIFDTMNYIAQSNMFIGTSLHGNITAISYGIKHVGLDKRVSKLKYFQKQFCVEGQQFADSVFELLNCFNLEKELNDFEIEENRKRILSLANENFSKISEIINQ